MANLAKFRLARIAIICYTEISKQANPAYVCHPPGPLRKAYRAFFIAPFSHINL
jgi:hypothetical protein